LGIRREVRVDVLGGLAVANNKEHDRATNKHNLAGHASLLKLVAQQSEVMLDLLRVHISSSIAILDVNTPSNTAYARGQRSVKSVFNAQSCYCRTKRLTKDKPEITYRHFRLRRQFSHFLFERASDKER
jgi:hypothetical protein